MTIHSMTGFGAAESTHEGWAMKAECRSVNHKGLDVRVWAPRDWTWIEPFALEQARALLNRGRVEVRIDVWAVDADGAADARIDRPLFERVAAELSAAAAAAGVAPPTTADVLGFEGVRSTVASRVLPENTELFERTITDALAALIQTRADEGRRLDGAMKELVDEVARCIEVIGESAAHVADEYRTRLEQRVRDALARFEVGELDERAILQEVAIYADKSDISEELQRASSHVHKLREVFLGVDGAPIGKQIDFYLQELFREANTTGSKSGSLAITDQVIRMKTAIEKMREQAANIE